MRTEDSRSLRRGTTTLVASFLIVCVSAVAAFAATFNMTAESPNGGAGKVNGTLTFTSAHRFTYDSYVQDICPADSLGVSFYFEIVKFGGALSDLTGIVDWDTNGCGNGFQNDGGAIVRNNFNIKGARVIMCWTNNGDLCWAIPIDGVGAVKDNPHT